MIVTFGLGDGKADRHGVEERSAGDPILRDARKCSLLRMRSRYFGLILRSGPKDRVSKDGRGTEITSNMERQLIGADCATLTSDQRGVGAARRIGDGFLMSERALSPISCKAILTPGAGRPATMSST